MATPTFTVGMQGPEAAISVHLTNPETFEGSFADATRVFEMTCTVDRGRYAVSIPAADWSWSDLTVTSGVASYVPDGTEFPSKGVAVVAMRLTLNGVAYDLAAESIRVKANTRVS